MKEEVVAARRARAQEKEELDTEFARGNKASAYKRFCLWLPTPRLRGWACAMAERIGQAAFGRKEPGDWDSFSKQP